MGQVLAAIRSLGDNSEGEKEANDALNCLVTLAQNRLDKFYRRITSPQYDPLAIPISKVLYRYQFFRCGVERNTESVKEAITSSLGDFATGDVVKGLTTLATSSLNVLFDNYHANQSSTTTYAISVGKLGGISRLDADFYSYQFTSTDLQNITKNVVVCSIVISSVDVLSLNSNDITTIVETCYSEAEPDVQKKIRDQVHKEWEAEKAEASVTRRNERKLTKHKFAVLSQA